mmetsp:Transcript_35548/g.69724  ORF Transcript_35548/g.69724 Transcript_35548/m.69724 type:complete len:80 (-) Transcript_35548:28-267(-)
MSETNVEKKPAVAAILEARLWRRHRCVFFVPFLSLSRQTNKEEGDMIPRLNIEGNCPGNSQKICVRTFQFQSSDCPINI